MKICVLQPDYSTTSVDYQYYDPPRALSPLLPGDEVHHVFLNKLTTYKQLQQLSKQGYDCFVNLCEGYLEWEIPSIDVIYFLEMLKLPFTGPTSQLYHPTKELMKYTAYTEGILSPAYAVVTKTDDVSAACASLSYPLFVKPAHAGDSLGIDDESLARNEAELLKKTARLLEEYSEVLIEEYVDGREFTVLVSADADNPKTCTAFEPIEYVFKSEKAFKTYALKTAELHPDANVPVQDEALATRLKEAASKIFLAFGGVGYARLDFRMNANGKIYFLEINFTCSIFYSEGYEGSADYILKFDPIGPAGFLKRIIAEGIARHWRSQKKFVMKGSAVAGYGIYAATDLPKGELIFRGEEGEHRLVTKRYVQTQWSTREQKTFAQYAYPISSEVYAIWDKNPENWAPQNHSCSPNTAYQGLNVVALKAIAKGEELTLDYATFLDETAAPFECNCGAENCRRLVKGSTHNSVSLREQAKGETNHCRFFSDLASPLLLQSANDYCQPRMSRIGVLKAIIAKHKYQLLLTNLLFAVEMLGPLLRPFFLGEAINDLIVHRYEGLFWLAGSQVLWLVVGTVRHRYDTRTYTAVYNSLVTRMMTKVKTAALSKLSAHTNLAREAVDFLQYDLNYVVEAAYNLVGSLLLLFVYEKKLVVLCLLMLIPVVLISFPYGRRMKRLNRLKNDELERQVDAIESRDKERIETHFKRLRFWQIKISDGEAFNFGAMELLVLIVIVASLLLTVNDSTTTILAGDLIGIYNYILKFVSGLDTIPYTVQRVASLRDILQRVELGVEEIEKT